ncbi:DoxX family protein [Paraferrimonas sp. SM1919]|uniref:DoxX family protein n=1 Tax=Paraferrimonas sp. SM1919 TaxID=2662263 RepID=UPI0013D74E4B|nr:DoxX family protein [Paraferrimonas sp. SM1919]
MNKLQQLASPLARFLLGSIFLMAGLSKIGNYEGTAGYMEAMGVPGGLLPLVILVEALSGLLVIIGFKTRINAFLLGGFSALSGLLFHFDPSNQMEMTMLMKNFAIAGGMLLLVINGGGHYSLDNRK